MVTLRLFHVADPFRPIASRTLNAAEMFVGRDPAADWPIDDSACELSRRHCSIRLSDEGVVVRDMSANGVFVGRDRRRMQRDVETVLGPDDVIHLGQFLITTELAQAPANDHAAVASGAIDAPFHAPMLQEPALSAADYMIRDAWVEPGEVSRNALPDAALLEAFCEGAGLDPSVFMGEDPSDVARRAGAVYRQAVLGLADLMNERSALKSHFQMNRTTVGAVNNNPFKWAEPHRIAVDLLQSGNGPFLSAGAAINASFQDLKKHLLSVMAGSRAAVAAAFEAVEPAKVEADADGRPAIFKAEARWRAYQERHAGAVADAHQSADSAVNRAFKTGYERNMRKLDGLGTVS